MEDASPYTLEAVCSDSPRILKSQALRARDEGRPIGVALLSNTGFRGPKPSTTNEAGMCAC